VATNEASERQHETLRESEWSVRAIIENAPEAIIVVDRECRVVLTNSAAHWLYKPPIPDGQELQSLTGLGICHPDGTPCHPQDLPLARSALYGERTTGQEMAMFLPNGHRRDLLASSAPIRDTHGRISGAVGVFEDVTELEQARREAQQRTAQMEALRQVGLQLVAELDLDLLLHSIVSQAVRLLNVDAGALYLYKPEQDALVWAVGINAEILTARSLSRGQGLAGKVWELGGPLVVDDYQHWAGRIAQYDGRPIASALGVPISWGKDFMGVLNVIHSTPRAFGPADTQLLSLLATQAAIAIRNAGFVAEQRKRRRHAEALARATAALTGTLQMGQLLKDLLAAAMEATPAAERGAVLLLNDEGNEIRVMAQVGYDHTGAEPASFGRHEQPLLWSVLNGESMLISEPGPIPSHILDLNGGHRPAQSAVLAPLRCRDTAIGVIVLASVSQQAAFTPADLSLLTTLAGQAAVAVDNCRLFEETRGKATLEERQRLARALHDSVTQSLYSLTLFAQAALEWTGAGDLGRVKENLLHISEAAQQSLKDMRLLVYELRPADLQQDGLVGALHHRLNAVEKRAGVEARLVAEPSIALPVAIEEVLYYIAQEALNNALKHAAAGSVTVYLRASDGDVELEIVDDGRGFSPDAVREIGGLGLMTMRERAERLGGSLTIQSAPGQGTRVLAQIHITGGAAAHRGEPEEVF